MGREFVDAAVSDGITFGGRIIGMDMSDGGAAGGGR